MKWVTLVRELDRIERALDRYEHGMYADLSIEYIANKISWLWKFRHISEDKMNELCDRVIAINTGRK